MSFDHCHYVRDPEAGRVLIPRCMGAAVYGPNGCTCPKPPRTLREGLSLEERLEALERRVAKLEGRSS